MSLVIIGGVWLFTLLTSFLLGYLLCLPDAERRKSSVNTLTDHALVSAFFLMIFLLFQRPFLAAVSGLVVLSVFIIVSNAKLHALREPLVFSDFALFSQVFKYPRLYLPFLDLKSLVVFIAVGGLGLVALLHVENSLLSHVNIQDSWSVVALLAVLMLAFIIGRAGKEDLVADPVKDIQQKGFLSSLLFSGYQSYRLWKSPDSHEQLRMDSPFAREDARNQANDLADIIVVQSESFFDARRLSSSINPGILQNFDLVGSKAVYSGQLDVPAWGANTMRTEFSFLTGIPSARLGLYKYYPYRFISNESFPSIANYLKTLGYVSICIHPHPAGFFGRDRAFSRLGFDIFLDIDDFVGGEKFGPYISDKSVTEKVLATLSNYREKMPGTPLFVFVITMENHGPLHLESVSPAECDTYFHDKPVSNVHDLVVYLRHLRNADEMINTLTNSLAHDERESILCFYGDHVPSMPDVYNELKYDNGQSDYFIWSNKISLENARKDLDAAELGQLLLKMLVK